MGGGTSFSAFPSIYFSFFFLPPSYQQIRKEEGWSASLQIAVALISDVALEQARFLSSLSFSQKFIFYLDWT